MANYSKKFIALDLETTHLDMKEGRIMEVGVVEAELFFDNRERRVKVKFGKIFDKLINPEIEPSQTALALTGIKVEELKTAPVWDEMKKDLEKFLGSATLLGQNIVFDLEFLKNQGLRKKYAFVDTLDVALTFLPLSPVHSLEYLSQEFGAPMGASHRALADAQNTAYVLVGILNEFLSFPSSLQAEIRDYLSRSGISYRELFLDLPQITLSQPSPVQGEEISSPLVGEEKGEGDFLTGDWPDKTILNLPLGFGQTQEFIDSLAKAKFSGVVGLAHPAFLESLPKAQVIPDPTWALCIKRYEWFRHQERIADAGLKVLIKLAIFRNLSPSLNLSLVKWGNVDRSIIHLIRADTRACQAHQCEYAKILTFPLKSAYFMNLTGLFELALKWQADFHSRRLLLMDLPRLEEEFVESLTRSWNLRKIRNAFTGLFPIEKRLPGRLPHLPKEVEAVLNEIDLFFGILHLVHLKKDGEFAENLLVDEQERSTERFRKFFHPAEKLIRKLFELEPFLKALLRLHLEDREEIESLRFRLAQFAEFLKIFFTSPGPQNICWLTFNSEWVDLNCCPADVAQKWRRFQSGFASGTIVETELPNLSLRYYQRRLGLEDFQISRLEDGQGKRDLEISISEKSLPLSGIVELCENLDGRTLVIVPNEGKLQDFFEIFTRRERPKKSLLSHRFSGNLTLLRSKLETMDKQGILLLTLNVFLKHFQTLPAGANLVLTRLPFEAPGTRSDLQALPQNYFLDHALPKAVTVLHTILSRFTAAAPDTARVYLLDNRILTDYDQAFLKYLESLPNSKISTV